jgi:hypothetical protein
MACIVRQPRRSKEYGCLTVEQFSAIQGQIERGTLPEMERAVRAKGHQTHRARLAYVTNAFTERKKVCPTAQCGPSCVRRQAASSTVAVIDSRASGDSMLERTLFPSRSRPSPERPRRSRSRDFNSACPRHRVRRRQRRAIPNGAGHVKCQKVDRAAPDGLAPPPPVTDETRGRSRHFAQHANRAGSKHRPHPSNSPCHLRVRSHARSPRPMRRPGTARG